MKPLAAIVAVILFWCRGLLPFPTYTSGLSLVGTRQGTNHSRTDGFRSSRFSRVNIIPTTTDLLAPSSDAIVTSIPPPPSIRVPKVFFVLNAATKWMVSVAVTVGVLWYPKSFRGPYIAVGSIGATVLANKLKRLINQGRPAGAPFTDPGMPSSHALVSFFVASSWGQHLGGPWAMSAALGVSILRVICGYHTAPQITVGGLLGSLLGYIWINLGVILDAQYTKALFLTSWTAYLLGSVLYIRKEVVRWFTDEKFL